MYAFGLLIINKKMKNKIRGTEAIVFLFIYGKYVYCHTLGGRRSEI